MNIFAESLIKKHKVQFNKGHTDLDEKHRQWFELVETTKNIFENIKFEIESQKFFNKLHMLNTLNIEETSKQLPSIQFSFGMNRIRYNNSKNEPCVESECTLQITLLVNGSVCCMLYPFSSGMQKRSNYSDPHIINHKAA